MAEIAWYKLEENAANTTVVDNANNSLTGTASANTSTLTAVGKVGNCFNFVGASSNKVTISDNALLKFATTGFTVAYWVNPDGSVGTDAHLSKTDNSDSGWAVGTVTTNDKVRFQIGNGTAITNYDGSNNSLSAATWQHVAVTYDATDQTIQIFVDGALDTKYENTVTLVDDTTDLILASLLTAFFDGQMDDVRIYKRPLNIEEVGFLYSAGSGTVEPLDAGLTVLANVNANRVAIEAATASGANVDDDANKVILPLVLGRNIKIVQYERPVVSPA